MFAASLPVLLGMAALAVDGGVWYLEQSRLQLAADAAALGVSRLLGSSPSQSSLQAAALQAVTDATGLRLIGTLVTPITVSATTTAVSVTVASKADGFFAPVLAAVVPTLQARATAGSIPKSCIFTTTSTLSPAVQVDNDSNGQGLIASNCGIFSNSSANPAIYLNSGEMHGTSVGAVGTVTQSNSGSNNLSPYPPNSDAAPQTDALAGMTPPTPGACSYVNANFTSYKSTPYQFSATQNVFCGNTTIGGNGSSDHFAAGIYYVVGGNLTFNDATVVFDSGVSFVLTYNSAYPNVGGFQWTNYSGTYALTAPTSGPTAGIAIWQVPPAGGCSPSTLVNPLNYFNGGSTLQMSGAFYAPCGELDLSNGTKFTTASGGSLSVTAEKIHVFGGSSISAGSASPPGGGAVAVLTQ